uniref:BPTI/Kunitz inhibitor domain-containing protein n=1 Tax=Caenorhabditis tropicalis TaxID=1561998 RepID=A0A1I7TYS1_9PELO
MFLLFLLPFVFVGSTVSQNICELPVDLGTNCSKPNATEIRFYYDTSLKRCLPFGYTGCGGNENSFTGFKLCRQRCAPLDNLFCPANSSPLPNNAGSNNCGKQPMDPKCGNLNTSYCHEGPSGGVCCSLHAKKMVDEDLEPKCKDGSKKYTVFKGQKDRVVLGKLCQHNFCPTGYNCQQGNHYAYCCSK